MNLFPWSLSLKANYIIYALSLIWLIYCLSLTENGVFFSGDGGLKRFMAKNNSTLISSVELPLEPNKEEALAWEIYGSLFSEPFVYSYEGKLISGFPPTFAHLTGIIEPEGNGISLYALPAVSILLCFSVCLLLSIRFFRNQWVASAFIASVCLSSPIVLYGAMYWEHAISIFLVAIFLFLLIDRGKEGKNSIFTIFGFLASFICGLSILFRPETYIIIFLFAILFCISMKRIYFDVLMGVFFAAVVHLTINKLSTGHLLGAHSIQIVSNSSVDLGQLLGRVMKTNMLFFLSFPVAFLLIYLTIKGLRSNLAKIFWSSKAGFVGLACVFSLAIIPLVAPNSGGYQWGSRYLLTVIVPLSFFVFKVLDDINVSKNIKLFIVLLIISGSVYNIGYGTERLRTEYASKRQIFEFIESKSPKLVAVTHQGMAQEFIELRDSETGFFVMNNEIVSNNKISPLISFGIENLMFIYYTEKKAPNWLLAKFFYMPTSYGPDGPLSSLRVLDSISTKKYSVVVYDLP